ncbi:lysozyme inhibitor LprI family protein [Dongia sp. agr-C8]
MALIALATPWRGPALAATPSFDCAAAAAPVEILICGNDELAEADAGLAALYRRLQDLLDEKAKADLLAGQRQWLKTRLATCKIPATGKTPPAEADKAAACLIGQYKERTSALAKLEDAASPTVVPVANALPTQLGLDRKTLPATGEQQSILSVAQFGRYAITVKSAQGVALQLVDRKAGPGEIRGVAGASDGRIDAFLDRGLYKILLHASEEGSGEAALTLHPYAELNGSDLPRLPEVKRIDTDLADFQQRSYWLEIKQRRLVAIEAAGRSLTDMRLWRDGNWLVDATPSTDQIEPVSGKPLAVRRIVTTLEPGLYLLAAYGGPELPWAKTSPAQPLHLRMGIPTLDEAGRQAFTASPFGIDRFLVPAGASYFRMELPEAEPATISVQAYDEQAPFAAEAGVEITKKSVPPIAEVFGSSESQGFKLVTIRREAGKPYVLQQFKAVDRYSFNGDGDYWIATLHSGYGEDNVDATALLTSYKSDVPERIIADNVPKLNRLQPFNLGRFNFIEPFTLYVQVTSPETYIITESGTAKGDYRFEPMIRQLPEDYKVPEFQPAGTPWKLDRGYYVLVGMPKNDAKGIAELRISAQGVAGSGGKHPKETAVLFPEQRLESGTNYSLYLNNQAGVQTGVVLRKLPIDLAHGLPLTLKAGKEVEIPVTVPSGGVLRAVAEDAKPLTFSIDGDDEVTEWRGDGAKHELTIENPNDKAMMASLQFTPESLAPDTPLPKLAPEILAAVPEFPLLEPRQTTYFDIAKGEQRTFALDIAEAGLYRVESSGLLQTEGNMRTRTVLSLDRQASNGTGRNFLLQQYLGQGSYQVSVAAQGETHGRMGVTAAPTVMKDGGALSLDVPARDTILAGDGLVYTFKIEEAGQYKLQSLGLGRTFTMRLEDQDGWPIITPNAPADLTMDFKPGEYRVVILPQPVEAKIVTLLLRIEEPQTIEGHGPHDLVLNRPQDFQWREPEEEGAERVPDQWRFKLPAAAHVEITLNQGMRADVVGSDGTVHNEVIGGDNWKGELPADTYTLRTTSYEPNNRFDYRVEVHVTELVAGQDRITNLPADYPISIGSDSVVEIGSFGSVDVRAWLYDADNKLVATNDDRPNDWNFAIAGRLQPGYYRLHLEAVGSATAEQKETSPAVDPFTWVAAIRLLYPDESDEVPPDGMYRLDTLAQEMLANEEKSIRVEGYAAATEEGEGLARRKSLARALAVRSYLMRAGVHSTQIAVIALGPKAGDGPADRVDIAAEGAQPSITDTIEDGENDQMTSGDAEYSEEDASSEDGASSEEGEYAEEGEGEVEPEPEAGPGQTRISIYQPEAETAPALVIGQDMELSGPKVHLVPLTGDASLKIKPYDMLVVAADAGGPAVGLALEQLEDGVWHTLSESVARSPWIALPLGSPKGGYRLRAWSADRSTDPIRLQARIATPPEETVQHLTGKGVALRQVEGIEPALGVVRVEELEPGTYRLAGPGVDIASSRDPGDAVKADPNGIIFSGRRLWFAARLDDATSIIARPLRLSETAQTIVVPPAGGDIPDIQDPTVTAEVPHLWLAESRLGQPMIASLDLVGDFARDSAVAIALQQDRAQSGLYVGNAGDRTAELPVSIRRFDFKKPVREQLAWGIADRSVKRRQPVMYALPAGLKRLSFALPPQTAVVLDRGTKPRALWSGDAARAVTLDSSTAEITILSVLDGDAQVGISITPIGPDDAMTEPGGGRIFKQYFPAEGVVRLEVHLSEGEKKSGAKLRLMVDGAVREAALLNEGRVLRGKELEVLPTNVVEFSDAIVDIAHGPGLVVAWIEGGDPLTSLGTAAQGIQVKNTSTVPLAGAAQQLVFTMAEPKFLRLKTTTPVIAELEPAQRLRVFPDGADLNLLLPEGTTPVVLRAAGEGPLSGLAEASLMDIAPIGEGLGPKVRLAPGESRLYSFTVKDERDIGVGVRGAVDVARCRVLDAEGKVIGNGVVQMLHLKAGTYLLAVDAPAEGNAIEVQPALVGVTAPDGSPPDEVKRVYLELAGLKPKEQE